MDMARNKKQIGIAIDPELLQRLDDWRKAQLFEPSRTEVIERLIKKFLDAEDDGPE